MSDFRDEMRRAYARISEQGSEGRFLSETALSMVQNGLAVAPAPAPEERIRGQAANHIIIDEVVDPVDRLNLTAAFRRASTAPGVGSDLAGGEGSHTVVSVVGAPAGEPNRNGDTFTGRVIAGGITRDSILEAMRIVPPAHAPTIDTELIRRLIRGISTNLAMPVQDEAVRLSVEDFTTSPAIENMTFTWPPADPSPGVQAEMDALWERMAQGLGVPRHAFEGTSYGIPRLAGVVRSVWMQQQLREFQERLFRSHLQASSHRYESEFLVDPAPPHPDNENTPRDIAMPPVNDLTLGHHARPLSPDVRQLLDSLHATQRRHNLSMTEPRADSLRGVELVDKMARHIDQWMEGARIGLTGAVLLGDRVTVYPRTRTFRPASEALMAETSYIIGKVTWAEVFWDYSNSLGYYERVRAEGADGQFYRSLSIPSLVLPCAFGACTALTQTAFCHAHSHSGDREGLTGRVKQVAALARIHRLDPLIALYSSRMDGDILTQDLIGKLRTNYTVMRTAIEELWFHDQRSNVDQQRQELLRAMRGDSVAARPGPIPPRKPVSPPAPMRRQLDL